MGWLLFGLALLFLGLYSKFWDIVGWRVENEGDMDDGSAVLKLIVRIVLTAFGVIFVSANFSGFAGISHPGLFVLSLFFLYVGFSDKLYQQSVFQKLVEYYTTAEGRDRKADPLVFFTSMRIISMVVGAIFLAIGIGTGHPDWKWEPCPKCEVCEVCKDAPAPKCQKVREVVEEVSGSQT